MNPEQPDRPASDPDPSGPDRAVPGPLETEPPAGPSRYRKVRVPTTRPLDAEMAVDQPVPAVVEVTEPGYRPSGVDVRATITDTLFTARIRPSALASLDQDPRVVSIELGNRLDRID